ncbi:hypothetical protein JD78_02133 [Modestobacter roseus]|uniref:Stress response protein n=1 Tax=Modestobacter roseus TaxID=1181884 RepID=A0A562IRE5_9ACTN|nr:hypothetical protein JD78_02133 [Modestobacter roseus]
MITAVKEFGRGLTQPFGAPAGAIEAFIEVPFMLGEKRCYPDGLIRVTRGQRSWTALVEVKTGTNELGTEQLENYLDIARENGFDALITISNEISPLAGQHPTKVDKRKLRKVAMHHLPWSQILAAAVVQKEHRGVADPDQAWILGELIRYLEHPRSGALEFEDMGASWVPVRDAVGAGTLRASDKGVADVAARFDALMRYVSLRLGRTLGTEVVPALTRREMAEPALRNTTLVESLVRDGRVSGAIRIPHAVAPLSIELDLRANRVTCHVDVDAPREGRPTTRVNWLVRQLRAAPESVRIEAFAMHARGPGAAELLRAVREDSAVLVQDPKREIRSFRVALTSPLGTKRGRGRGAAIDSVLDAVETFYGEVLQNLRAWTAAAPKMRDVAELPKETSPALASTALSSQDGVELAASVPAPDSSDDGADDGAAVTM